VAPVGLDGVKQVAQAFSGRHIDTDLLEILNVPTYRWRAHQEHGSNVDLGSSDDIYNSWEPVLPADFDGWAFVGSMRPDRQAYLMKHLGGASFLAADAMLSYVKSRPKEAKDVLRRAGWFFCNKEELEALGGKDPEEFRRQWWLKGLVVKAGAQGLAAYTEYGVVRIPAHTHPPAVDTTGAGDALAGGMLATFTITPALSVIILPSHLHETETRIMAFLHQLYVPVLSWAVDNRKLVMAGAAGLVVMTIVFSRLLGLEFLRSEQSVHPRLPGWRRRSGAKRSGNDRPLRARHRQLAPAVLRAAAAGAVG